MAQTDSSTPKFTVVGQVQTSRANPAGGYLDVWQITFQTPQGETGNVYVPVAGYSAANVAAAITAAIATMDEVRSLGS